MFPSADFKIQNRFQIFKNTLEFSNVLFLKFCFSIFDHLHLQHSGEYLPEFTACEPLISEKNLQVLENWKIADTVQSLWIYLQTETKNFRDHL